MNTNEPLKTNASTWILATLTLFLAYPAMGQTPDRDQPAVPRAVALVEEVIVTARRRTEDLQEVPESVTLLDAETLETARVDTLRELSELVPNFNLFAGEQAFRAGVVQMVVRGITTPQNGEAPMSFVVDGVTMPEIDFINQDLFDVESVQVLRGPQGALYGRGALGGAVLIDTKQPSDELRGFVAGAYEEGDDRQLRLGISGPIASDKLLFRLSASLTDREGLINNTSIGEPVDFKDAKILRAGLRYLPSEDVTMDWNINFLNSEIGGGIYSFVALADLNRNFENSISQNILGVDTRDILQVSMKIDWRFGGLTLTSVSAYAEIDDEIVSDGDFGADVLFAQRNATKIDSYTQELRLASEDDSRFRWILGAFYQSRQKEFFFDFADDVGRSTGGFAERFDVTFEQWDSTDSEALGLFAQASLDISEQLELTGALRLDRDSREFEDPRAPETGTSESFDELQPKISLAYQWSRHSLLYLSFSHGFRSGGFNEIGFGTGDFGGPPTVYQAENSDSIELGTKNRLLDGRMTLNAAVFFTKLENNQFTSFDVETFTLGILGINEAEITGLDLEVSARPTAALEISLGLGLSSSEMVDYDGTGLFDGNDIPYVPGHSFNVGVQYTWALPPGQSVVARADYSGMSRVSLNQSNEGKRKATEILNLGLTWRNPDWSVSAFVKNLTDERAPVDFFDAEPGIVGRSPNAPRAFGIEVRYDY